MFAESQWTRGTNLRRMRWQGSCGVGGGFAAPLGPIVEARLNGARAGKVSAQRCQQRRKYHSCEEARYLTPHSHSVQRKERRRSHSDRKKKERNAIEPGDFRQTEERKTCRVGRAMEEERDHHPFCEGCRDDYVLAGD